MRVERGEVKRREVSVYVKVYMNRTLMQSGK